MDMHDIFSGDVQSSVQRAYFRRMFQVDITADLYTEIISGTPMPAADGEQRLSELFRRFAQSPYCHSEDAERFLRFTELTNLRQTLRASNLSPASIVYRRKFDLTQKIYSTAILELYPAVTEEGHLTALMLERDISNEITQYNLSLEENAKLRGRIRGKRKILIVEDIQLNREILTEILSDDYQILEAENGAVGLELLQQNITELSAVLLDIQMPVMDGYTFLQQVRNNPFLSHVPIIVTTSLDSIEDEQRCLELGASDFINKPYNAPIIRSRLAGIIRLKESAATVSMLQTDEQTQLYSLQAFYYHARLMLEHHPQTRYSVFIIHIDHFKTLQASYGYETGIRILQNTARVLSENITAAEISGRYSDARFVVFREYMPQEDTNAWLDKLFAAMTAAGGIKGITFKAGIYDCIDTALPLPIICDRATVALDSVGSRFEQRYARYDEKYARQERRMTALEAEMQEAYRHDQFRVYYQPKHNAATGALVGAEALLRWVHPEFGFLSPAEFIPLFERNGFISYADYYVLKRTCRNLRAWMDEGIPTVPISINASRRDFELENYLKIIQKPLNRYRIIPTQIHLEVTESLFSERIDELSRVLQECKDAGIRIELDDFGSGYSSLTTLASLPLDVVKLDMSFMKNIHDEKKYKVLATCIDLCRRLNLKTVAEGVETEEQLKLLQQLGCDRIQGYYFSKPLPEAEFREYLLKYAPRN